MKTMSVRDIRQRWPEAESALEHEDEIIVTRDGKPVARLVPFEPRPAKVRASVDWDALERWRTRFWSGAAPLSSVEDLARDRADRD